MPNSSFYAQWKMLLCFSLFVPALQAQTVDFIRSGNLVEAKAKAKETGKMLFVDIYTDWCGPCKMMDREFFSDPEIAGRMNAFFVNLKANAEGNGSITARQFETPGYPTMVFLTSDGSMIRKVSGAPSNKTGFLVLLNSILNSTNVGEIFLSYEKAWYSDLRSAEIAEAYLGLRSRYQMQNEALLEEYLQELPADSLDNPGVKKVFTRYAATLDGKTWEYLILRKNDPRCAVAIKRIIDTQFKNAVAEKSEKHLARVLDAVANTAPDPEYVVHRQATLKMQFYLDTDRPERFHAVAAGYIPDQLLPLLKTEEDSVRLQQHTRILESIAWQYAEFVKKKAHLTQAMDWLNQCPEKAVSTDFLAYREAIARKAAQ